MFKHVNARVSLGRCAWASIGGRGGTRSQMLSTRVMR